MAASPTTLLRLFPLLLVGRTAHALVPDFSRHPLAHRSQGAPAAIWAPRGGPLGSPGFAAIRSFSMAPCDDKYTPGVPGSGPCGPTACSRTGANCSAPIPSWTAAIDLVFNSTADGGLDLANCVWPGWNAVFSPYWPDLARLLVDKRVPAVDLGGFVPGGAQDFDVNLGVPSTGEYMREGMAILGDLYMGLDMGEQDVRYLWGYAGHTVLPGPTDHFEQYMSFADYSWQIEWQSGGRLASLSSTVYAHYWLKSGLFTSAGAETSQSNGNSQMLYSFIRGAGKQYGVPWFGQVSIFNWFGYKVPGDQSPTHPPGPDQCKDQSSHSATCGTSLSLMKRLMYTELLYDSCYFAFEGQWTYAENATAITPIGTLQQQAKRFFSSKTTPHLGTHVVVAAIMLDFYGGWTRPCDNKHGGYSAAAWGNVAWDGADYLADAVFDVCFPGYRGGAMNHDESYYLSPTPYGDSIDTLLSDALPSVMAAYHTLVVAHRMTAEPAESARKLHEYAMGGGQLVITASSVFDMGGVFAGVTIGACATVPPGAVFIVGSTSVAEPTALSLCEVASGPANMTVLAQRHGRTGSDAAVRVAFPGGGSVIILAHGNYAMSTHARTTDVFKCGIDEDPHADRQPFQLAQVARTLIDQALKKAALFDLGPDLTWVPKRISDTEYILGVSNNYLKEMALSINISTASSRPLGKITGVAELALDQSEKSAVGYMPHGFEHADLGKSTKTTIAGADMRIFKLTLAATAVPSSSVRPPDRFGLAVHSSNGIIDEDGSASKAKVLLRLSARISSIRTEIEKRPSFFNYFSGVMVDSDYFYTRSTRALEIENRWLQLQHVDIVCDFTRSTDLFPGLRLIDDIHPYYNESMEIIEDVLSKLPIVRSSHAMLTLHGAAELAPVGPCINGAGQESGATFTACFRQTLQMLTAKAAAAANVTLHLRHSSRNAHALGATLSAQVAFTASIDGSKRFKIAPSTGVAAPLEQGIVQLLLQTGKADLLLLSAPSAAAGSSPLMSPLAATPTAQQAALRAVVRAADAAGSLLVLDAGFARNGVDQQGEELTDVHFLRSMLGTGARIKTDDANTAVCANDAECYGGACHSNRCVCPPMWTGDHCERLSLAPARIDGGMQIHNESTWGGGLIQDTDSGLWQMYFAHFVGNCGLKSWTSNSEIRHAVASRIEGPYTKTVSSGAAGDEPVLGTFSHNPSVQRVGPASWLLGHIGCGNGTKTPIGTCTNGTTCNATVSTHWAQCQHPQVSTSLRGLGQHGLAAGSGGGCDNPHWTGFHHAKSPRGPWLPVVNPLLSGSCGLQVDGGPTAWHKPCITNPNLWPFYNGSLLIAYSTGCANCTTSAGHKHVGLAFAPAGLLSDGDGDEALTLEDLTPSEPIFPWASEDPTIFLDTTNGKEVWHILAHTDYHGVAEGGLWKHVAAHAVAEDPRGPWTVLPYPPYNRTIQWVGGETTDVETRERPQLIFSGGWGHGKRVPVALTNGVTPGNATMPGNDTAGFTGDWSYTHVQRIELVTAGGMSAIQ